MMALVKVKFTLLALLLVAIPYSVGTAKDQPPEQKPVASLPLAEPTRITPQPTIAEATQLPEPIAEFVFCGSPHQNSNKRINISNATLGRDLAAEYGWTGPEWNALLELWSCESSWQHTVSNAEGSGAYGIPQALPADKMAVNGSNWQTDPTTQIRWGLNYIKNRYGTPSAALDFHYLNNYY